MCNLADRIEEKALEKGKRQGIKQGIEQEKIQTVVTLIKKLNLSFDEAVHILDVADSLVETCREYVNMMNA